MQRSSRRRGRSEGTAFELPDGKGWRGVVHVGYGPDGRRLRRYVRGRTQAEVADRLLALRSRLAAGLPLPSERETVGAFLERWLATIKPTVRPGTWASYHQLVTLHLVPTLGRRHLAKVGVEDVQALLAAKLASGLSPRRVQMIRAVLRHALADAERWGLVARNVARLTDAPRVVRRPVEPMTAAAARAIIAAAAGSRLEALVTVALTCGLRQGELVGLRWQDVDLVSGRLSVRHQLVREAGGGLVLAEPKSQRSRRNLPLPAMAHLALKGQWERQEAERVAAGPRWHATGHVFATAEGQPIDHGNLRREWGRLLRAAGLPALSFHSLRHGCASLLIAQGVPLRTVQELLGHESYVLTADTYSHLVPSVLADAASLMDTALAGPWGALPPAEA